MNVRLARAKVAAFDGVVEQPVNAVAVVLVVLGGVDAALGGDRVCATRAVLVTKDRDVVPRLTEGGSGCGPRETGTDDDDAVLPPVRRVHQLHVEAMARPARLDGTAGAA